MVGLQTSVNVSQTQITRWLSELESSTFEWKIWSSVFEILKNSLKLFSSTLRELGYTSFLLKIGDFQVYKCETGSYSIFYKWNEWVSSTMKCIFNQVSPLRQLSFLKKLCLWRCCKTCIYSPRDKHGNKKAKRIPVGILWNFEIWYIFMKLKLYINNDHASWDEVWEPQWTAAGLLLQGGVEGFFPLWLWWMNLWIGCSFQSECVMDVPGRPVRSGTCLYTYTRACTGMTFSFWTSPTTSKVLSFHLQEDVLSLLWKL